jgi:hypothetical protein
MTDEENRSDFENKMHALEEAVNNRSERRYNADIPTRGREHNQR